MYNIYYNGRTIELLCAATERNRYYYLGLFGLGLSDRHVPQNYYNQLSRLSIAEILELYPKSLLGFFFFFLLRFSTSFPVCFPECLLRIEYYSKTARRTGLWFLRACPARGSLPFSDGHYNRIVFSDRLPNCSSLYFLSSATLRLRYRLLKFIFVRFPPVGGPVSDSYNTVPMGIVTPFCIYGNCEILGV